jgi:hypothetical protein
MGSLPDLRFGKELTIHHKKAPRYTEPWTSQVLVKTIMNLSVSFIGREFLDSQFLKDSVLF